MLGPVFAPCSKGSLLGPPSRLGHNGPGYRIHHLKSHQIFSGEKEVKNSILKQKRILPRSTDWLNKARKRESQETLPGQSKGDTSNNLVALESESLEHTSYKG